MERKIRCLSTDSSWTIRPFPSRRTSPPPRREVPPPTLVILRRPRRETERVVERRTILQTVVHNHITKTVYRPLRERHDTVFHLLSQPAPAREDETRSRPTLAARRLVRLFSAASAQRELGQFFRGVVGTVLQDDVRRALSRPGRETSLVYHVWGERALRETVERLTRELWERGERPAASPPAPAPPRRPADPGSGPQFRALLQGIERSLERKERLEALRQGRR